MSDKHFNKDFDIGGRSICIAVPSYGNMISFNWMDAYVQTFALAYQYGVDVGLQVRAGSGLIAHCRSELAYHFLHDKEYEKYDTIMFIDDDVVWRPDDFMRLVAFTSEHDLVAGVYCVKQEKPKFFCDVIPDIIDDDYYPVLDDNGLIKVRTVPGGFIMITRKALEEITEHYKDELTIRYRPEGPEGPTLDLVHLWFMNIDEETRDCYGEDIAFCHRWTKAGKEIWVDPEITLEHEGKKSYKHQLRDHLWDNTEN